jgi:hypothetical protein
MKTNTWSIIACIAVLAAVLAVPALAAGTDYSYPKLDNSVASQKAHIAWKAAERETVMSASIAYIGTLNSTNTAALDSLLAQYRGQEAQAATLSTHTGLDNLLREMNQVNLEFRQELRNQMTAGRGRPAELKAQVDAAVKGNPALASLESAYWSTRTTGELANFDIRVQRAGTVLSNLSVKGYDTTQAQAKLTEITALRSTLEPALNSHDRTQIQAVQEHIRTLFSDLGQIVKDLQVQVPQDRRIQFPINEGNRAVARAEMINADLRFLDIDTSMAEQYTGAAKADLAAAQAALDADNFNGAKTSLNAARQDLKSLAQAYRDIAARYKSDATTASTLTATAAALDNTAASMGSDA